MTIQRRYSFPVLGAALLLMLVAIGFFLLPPIMRTWNRMSTDSSLIEAAMDQGQPAHTAESVAAIRAALEQGANVNTQSSKGVTALVYCAANGNIEAVKLLLRYHADANIRTWGGDSALDAAKRHKNEEIVCLIQQAGGK